MARYRRVNIDGKSITETRLTAAAINPGTVVVINGSGLFAQASAISGRMYLMNPCFSEGLEIGDAVPSGASGVGEYIEEGRELAVRMAAGAYKKDQPVTMNSSGQIIAIPVTAGAYTVIGYIQDEVTTTAVDFIRIRIRAGSVTVS